MMTKRTTVAIGLLTIGLAVLASCNQAQPLATEIPSTETPQLVKHAVIDAKIASIMRRLNALMQEQEFTELTRDRYQRQYTEDLVAAALALSAAAGELAAADPSLTPAVQRDFGNHARNLLEQTQELARLAEQSQIVSLREQYARVSRTCAACHESYRNR